MGSLVLMTGLLGGACGETSSFSTCAETVEAAAELTVDVVDARVAGGGPAAEPHPEADGPAATEGAVPAFSRWLAAVQDGAQDLAIRNRLSDIADSWDELECDDERMFRAAIVQRIDEEIAQMDPGGGPVTKAQYVRANTLISLRMVLEGEAQIP